MTGRLRPPSWVPPGDAVIFRRPWRDSATPVRGHWGAELKELADGLIIEGRDRTSVCASTMERQNQMPLICGA
jgi:hypothetical protein